MKQIATLFFACLSILCNAQDVSVDKTVFGIQTGFLGIWIHNESKLSKELVLRSELGFDSGIWGRDYYNKIGFLMTPVITLEPRFYYNLNKRNAKSKDITKNSGNYFSLQTGYHPNWFVISNYKDVSIISDISIIPSWGIRRNLGMHFNYEIGIGFGYRYIFAKAAGYFSDKSEVAGNLILRFGYVF